ncbi:MAG TPA: DNA mismatch repair endonuclease MutL [Dictyoglomaceae bacterium]|nr:DNA mismatch repair endonuclease MutL [Dictyoglomaceae bacterium]HOL38741.1 DNA mismatch repair endonuclease MutL [Dictyoglomaceae bacterium]HOP94555.1 DNA mismatch repair endonuclease MutL [Dictyoglomaceae bacterium]HPP15510.1 DNA mismatch repair endonuclease MutL [Dictyoglomaceae bacterium]HPU43081.1 DNA mismatch repair endonuclease MutL [Dictyoglomaceae bacterium]
MGKIILLPEEIRNKIAAGEVVERPVSAVKELVENSIDAGAKRITIEIVNAGEDLISVTDDGEGMTEEDALLALHRFATSKIKNSEDLFHIKTLGFRGEALASIANISKMTIKTKTKDNNGVEIHVEAGDIKEVLPWEGMQGTTVRVENLFYNVPARKKFLKSRSTETNLIIDFVRKISLAYPEISFQLIQDGNSKFITPGNSNIEDVIIELFGTSTLKSLIKFENSEGNYRIEGMLSVPGKLISFRSQDYFFLNRRWIRNSILLQAVREGYKGRILENYYPFVILFIEVPYEEIDVNVHPTKREVKFEKDKEILNFVENSIRKSLEEYDKSSLDVFDIGIGKEIEGENKADTKINAENFKSLPLFSDRVSFSEPMEEYVASPLGVKIIGQVFDNYIIVEMKDRLFIIDQHAAHERIRYEEIKEKINLGKLQNVEVIFPLIIEVSKEERRILEEKKEILERFAFSWEDFGPMHIRLNTIPYEFLNFDTQSIENLFKEILTDLEEKDLEILENNIIKSLSCHSAIRSGDILVREEIEALVKMIFENKIPLTCPHGRPFIWEIKKEELERYFHRR